MPKYQESVLGMESKTGVRSSESSWVWDVSALQNPRSALHVSHQQQRQVSHSPALPICDGQWVDRLMGWWVAGLMTCGFFGVRVSLFLAPPSHMHPLLAISCCRFCFYYILTDFNRFSSFYSEGDSALFVILSNILPRLTIINYALTFTSALSPLPISLLINCVTFSSDIDDY